MSRTARTVLIVVGVVLAVIVALHVFAAPLMTSLGETIHSR